jgi:hypothetical protein
MKLLWSEPSKNQQIQRQPTIPGKSLEEVMLFLNPFQLF